MGTRVDFYVGRGESAEWLGSYPWDGYPGGVFSSAEDQTLFAVPPREAEWRAWVADWLADPEQSGGATKPDMGWPWPWDTSATTDYAYAWDGGVIYGSCFGAPWFQIDPAAENWGEPDDSSEIEGDRPVFPDMSISAGGAS
jgi:hypothetical protein